MTVDRTSHHVDNRAGLIHGLFLWRANGPFPSLREGVPPWPLWHGHTPTHPAIAGSIVSAEVIEADSTERKTQ